MKVLFLGDFFYSYENIVDDLKNIGNYIKDKQLTTVLNLEGPIADAEQDKKIKKRGPNLSQSKCVIEALDILNVKGVCLANNHMMDYGTKGLKKTLNTLDTYSILHTGAGENLEVAAKSMLIEAEDKDVRILNFGWYAEETVYATEGSAGCSKRESDFVIEKIKSEKKENEILVIVFHWGFEFNLYPMPIDRNLAYKCIENGADLIIGHHPHNLQPMETYMGKNIYYSLGNFYMSSMREKFNVDYSYDNSGNFYSDIGCGVIFDTDTCECKSVKFEYSRDQFMTNVYGEFELENITEEKFSSDEYVSKVLKGNFGINPMMTLNEKENDQIVRKHIRMCKFYNKIKVLRKCKAFELVYNIAKARYKDKNNV